MNIPRFLLLGLALPLAATAAVNKAAWKAELMNAEREFAREVAKGDVRAGFLKFMAPDAFHPNDLALSRAELAAKTAPPAPPPGVTLQWEPLFADVSDDGTLGYTWGYFKVTAPPKDGQGAARTNVGMTLTIWKRQADGSWKWVYDGAPTVPADKVREFLNRPDLPNQPTLLN